MSITPSSSRRPSRDKRVEAKVDARIHAALEDFAIKNGYTTSSAIYRVLLDWDKNERRKRRRGIVHA